MKKPRSLVVGDLVQVLDTANGKLLEAFVRQLNHDSTQVYVTRFKNTMAFDSEGKTRLGRFELKGRP